ncbi:hypothetical protein AB6A40_000647 [Gnathostoma spinigerum]|uniref:SF4 helicase domain-containing protein n=1 Tax=Gnathostoma spinigerum TaxID=75299 RepID=A0ABD6E2K8_9BILA
MVVRKLARFCWLSNNFCRLHKLGSSSLLEKYKSTLAEPPLDILVRDISRVLSQRRRDVEEPMPGPSYLQDKEGQQQQKGPRLTRSEIMDTLCDLGIQCKLTPHTGRVQIYCPECGTHRLFISPRNNSAMCVDCGYQASFTELCDLLKKSGKDSERIALQWRDSNRTVVNKDPLSSKYRFEAEARPPVDNKGAKMNDHDGIARYSSLEELDSDIYDRVSYLNLMSEYEKKERQRKLEEIESLRRLRDEAEKLSSRSPRGKAIDSLSEKNNMIPSVDPMIRMIWADAIDLYDVRDVAEQSDFLALRKELGVDRISYDTLSRFYVKGHMDAYDHPALCYPRYRGPCGRTRPPAGLKIIRRVGERLEKENFPEPDESGRRVFSGIFGYHLVAASDQRIVLTTNERDAMAVYEATGGLLSIALPMGEKLDENVLPYLEEFDIVYLWFPFIHDKYAKDYASFLNANRCQIINHQERPIELLRGGRLAEIDVAIRRRAVRVRSKGFRSMIDVRSDLKSELINSHSKQFGIARWKRFDVLNKYLLGFRPRELTVITGGTGFGKTTFLCEYSLDLLSQGVRTLFCSFEMPDEKVLKWMLVQFAA